MITQIQTSLYLPIELAKKVSIMALEQGQRRNTVYVEAIKEYCQKTGKDVLCQQVKS